jgi:A/G-specific adenine glycosylase
MMASSPATVRKLRRELLAWFDANARDLPWRQSADPYHIWVSEIMLQQTRVTAVLAYYARFLVLFPSVGALALAKEPDVLAAWSGLGYYRRARLMHKAAQVVLREHQGTLPRTAADLRQLPGIGEYTSSAIASIAFGEPVAVVDGNVERVLLRIFPEDEEPASPAAQAKWLRGRAASLLDTQRPGDFNQAMMELGATICLPKNPLCLQCPVHLYCATRGGHRAPPAKQMRTREIAYALLRRNRSGVMQVLLERRPQSASLMPGMWELPEVAMEEMQENDQERVEITLRHAITVTNYRVQVLSFSETEAKRRWHARDYPRKWARSSELGRLPLTGLTRKVLRRLQIMNSQEAVTQGVR